MNAPIKSDELLGAWSRGQWHSLYLFTGQEDFLIEQAVLKACSQWLKDDSSGLNRDRFDGETHSISEIASALRTAPFLSASRVVQIDHISSFSAKEQTELAEALQDLPSGTHVLLVWGKEWRRDDAKKPLVETIQAKGQVVIFWPLFPEAAARWVVSRAKEYRKSISPEAAVWLVQQQGEGLRGLDQEIQKVSAYVGERPQIELEDLHASFGYEKASSPFEWVSAVRGKETGRSLQLLKNLLAEGEAPLMLLALVSRGLRDWLTAKNSGENAAMMTMRFHLRRGEENKFFRDLGRWTESDLLEGIRLCLDVEQGIKSGKEEPAIGLTLLNLSLCGRQPAYALR